MNTSSPVPFTQALRFWLKLGFVSFGAHFDAVAALLAAAAALALLRFKRSVLEVIAGCALAGLLLKLLA